MITLIEGGLRTPRYARNVPATPFVPFDRGDVIIAPSAPVHLEVHIGNYGLVFGEAVTREGHVLLEVESTTLEGVMLTLLARGLGSGIFKITPAFVLNRAQVGVRVTAEGYGVFGLDQCGEPDVPLVLVGAEPGSFSPCEAYALTRGKAPAHYRGNAPVFACARATAAFVRAWAA